MTIGRKIVVTFHEAADGTPVADKLELTDTFTYNGVYTSNVVVKKDDVAETNKDRFVVTYYWASGAGPNLATATIQSLLNDAVAQVNSAMSGEVPGP